MMYVTRHSDPHHTDPMQYRRVKRTEGGEWGEGAGRKVNHVIDDRELHILNNIRGPPGPDVVRREKEQERLVHPFLNGVPSRGNRWGTRGLTDS